MTSSPSLRGSVGNTPMVGAKNTGSTSGSIGSKQVGPSTFGSMPPNLTGMGSLSGANMGSGKYNNMGPGNYSNMGSTSHSNMGPGNYNTMGSASYNNMGPGSMNSKGMGAPSGSWSMAGTGGLGRTASPNVSTMSSGHGMWTPSSTTSRTDQNKSANALDSLYSPEMSHLQNKNRLSMSALQAQKQSSVAPQMNTGMGKHINEKES